MLRAAVKPKRVASIQSFGTPKNNSIRPSVLNSSVSRSQAYSQTFVRSFSVSSSVTGESKTPVSTKDYSESPSNLNSASDAVPSSSSTATPNDTPTSSIDSGSSPAATTTSTAEKSHPYPTTERPTFSPTPTGLPGANLPPARTKKHYSPLTISVVTGLARLFGYNSQTSTAIRTSSDYYDRCAERGEVEGSFFYEECALPPSFQTWFSLTTLHVWLLSVRFRALPPPLGRVYIQELINHMFIDVELRIRGPYAVTQGRLIKGYMRDMLEQYHGAIMAYDEGLIRGDAVLAAAIWRNIFGAGWGSEGVGGVKGKKAPKPGEAPKLGPSPNPFLVDPVQAKLIKKGQSPQDFFETDQPIVNPDVQKALQNSAGGNGASAGSGPIHTLMLPEYPDLEFSESLEKLVIYVRKELNRLENLSDHHVKFGTGPTPVKGKGNLTDFSRI